MNKCSRTMLFLIMLRPRKNQAHDSSAVGFQRCLAADGSRPAASGYRAEASGSGSTNSRKVLSEGGPVP